MKATGMTRQIDELGRFVLPIEIRRTLDIKDKDSLEIFTEDSRIILQKYEPCCALCGSNEDVEDFNGKRICRHCIDAIKKL